MTEECFYLSNEFASVRIAIDHTANGDRLEITALESGACVRLDPLELESLAWVRHEDLGPIVRPGYREQIIDALTIRMML